MGDLEKAKEIKLFLEASSLRDSSMKNLTLTRQIANNSKPEKEALRAEQTHKTQTENMAKLVRNRLRDETKDEDNRN